METSLTETEENEAQRFGKIPPREEAFRRFRGARRVRREIFSCAVDVEILELMYRISDEENVTLSHIGREALYEWMKSKGYIPGLNANPEPEVKKGKIGEGIQNLKGPVATQMGVHQQAEALIKRAQELLATLPNEEKSQHTLRNAKARLDVPTAEKAAQSPAGIEPELEIEPSEALQDPSAKRDLTGLKVKFKGSEKRGHVIDGDPKKPFITIALGNDKPESKPELIGGLVPSGTTQEDIDREYDNLFEAETEQP